jgi:hypothetical protein
VCACARARECVYIRATASVRDDFLVNKSGGKHSAVKYTAFPYLLFTILPNAIAVVGSMCSYVAKCYGGRAWSISVRLRTWTDVGLRTLFPLTFRNPASYIKDGHTATFNTPHFLYFFNKYTY